MQSKYHRILLKLSGESLAGPAGTGIDTSVLQSYVHQIKSVVDSGVQVAIVIGGGNIFRGLSGATRGFDRVTGDQMGMLATVINSLALRSALESIGCPARVFTATNMYPVGAYYSSRAAVEALNRGKVAILAGGTGNPFFTTDTTAALRAAEIGAEIVLKATNVDGIYTDDPKKNPNATLYKEISFDEAMVKHLKVMDSTAFALCRDQGMPLKVFSIKKRGALKRVILGQDEGTLVHV